MKKALIIEDKERHNEQLSKLWTKILKFKEYESEVVKNSEEARLKLRTDDYGLAVIHHIDFYDVNFLRVRFPMIIRIGYSWLSKTFKDLKEGTEEYEFCKKMREHYDYITTSENTLPSILEEIAQQKPILR
jgi:hypothetical protein